jgi:transposase-like protein
MGIMVAAGESCRAFMEKTIRKCPAQVLELDEQWAFVFCKRKHADRMGYDESVGDRYVFTAIDRETKLLLCWHAGLRSADDTYVFVHKLYLAVGGRPSINTDGYSPYKSAVPLTFCHQVDYAQIVKHFQNGGDGQQRYSPGSIIRAEKKVICGNVPEHSIGTSRMERFNLTTRMHNRRFTRLTNAHSKKQRNHDAMLGLYFAWYNWVRKHSTIKTTPAVAAKLASEPWSLEKLLTMAAAA